MRKNNNPEEILDLIKSKEKIITCMDARFDYDSFCSVLAMSKFLESLGKNYEVTYFTKLPEQAKEVFDTSLVKENVEPNKIDFSKYDLLIFLDSGDSKHLNKLFNFKVPSGITTLCIDHHTKEELYADYNYVDDAEVSNCSLLLDLLESWKFKIEKDVATFLFTGLLFDSGFFQFKKTNAESFKKAARLIELGADKDNIIQKTTFNEEHRSMIIKKILYKNLVVDFSNRFAYSILSIDGLRRNKISTTEHNSISPADEIKKLSGVDFVFVITEVKRKSVFNVSLRSHNLNFDVAKIANGLGGAGHQMAAGANVKAKSFGEVVKMVLDCV